MGRLFKQYLEEDYGPKFACAQCNADVATYSDLIWEGFMGAQEPAYLFDNAMNLQPTSVTRQEVLSSGTYELADVSCRHCATALGWLYLSSSKEEQRYKEGKVLLAQSLLRRTCPGREDSVSSSELANIPGLRATAISSAAAMAAAVRFAQEIGQRQAQLEAEQQQQQQDEEGARQQLQALVREGQHQMTEQEEEEARLQPEEQGQSSLQQQVHAVAQEQRWALGHENTGEVAGLTPEQLQQLLHARLELAQQSEHLVQQQRRDLLFLRQQEERALQQREAAQQLQQQQGQGQGQDQPRRQHRAGGGGVLQRSQLQRRGAVLFGEPTAIAALLAEQELGDLHQEWQQQLGRQLLHHQQAAAAQQGHVRGADTIVWWRPPQQSQGLEYEGQQGSGADTPPGLHC